MREGEAHLITQRDEESLLRAAQSQYIADCNCALEYDKAGALELAGGLEVLNVTELASGPPTPRLVGPDFLSPIMRTPCDFQNNISAD
jgi:hypothetical protein